MPIIPSAQHGGWVRVTPPKRRALSPAKQAEAIRSGPLSYFACQPGTTYSPKAHSKLPPCPKYDLDGPSPPPSPKKKKSRVVSAPHTTIDSDPEDYDDYGERETDYISARPRERERASRRTASAAPRTAPPPPRAAARQQEQGQSKYWTGPSNRNRTPPAPRSSHLRSTVSSSWASATQPLNL